MRVLLVNTEEPGSSGVQLSDIFAFSEGSVDYVNSIFDLLLQSSDRCVHISKEFPTKEILHIQSHVFVLSAGSQTSGL